MDPGTVAVIGLCAFLTLWYAGGYLYNRRHGRRLYRWLSAGLDVLGGEREAGWIGSPASGARINIVHARPPFRRLQITLLLERREILPLWLLDHLRGKRDGLIVRATLRSPRRGEVEVAPVRRGVLSLRKGASPLRQEQSWTREKGPGGLVIAYRGPGAQRQVAGLKSWLETRGDRLYRFSWQKRDPHIQLQMSVGRWATMSSETLMSALQTAVTEATHT